MGFDAAGMIEGASALAAVNGGPSPVDHLAALVTKEDTATLTLPAVLLGRLSELAHGAPQAYRELLEDGARQVGEAGASGRLDPAAADAFATRLSQAAATGGPAALVPLLGKGAAPAPQQELANALMQRVDAALGLRAPPFGPWFPR
jgi:hypothetical protein